MRTLKQIKERMKDYTGVDFIYTDFGYIAWQCSTGENYEILFIETKEKRKGYGKKLIRLMCKKIQPYHSVFVIRLDKNKEAGKFYTSLGFKETKIKGLYRDDNAVIGVIPFNKLKKI